MWLGASVDAVAEGLRLGSTARGAALFYVVFIIIGAFFDEPVRRRDHRQVQRDEGDPGEEDEIEGRAKGVALRHGRQRRWQLVERMMSKCKPTRVYEQPKHPARAGVLRRRDKRCSACSS